MASVTGWEKQVTLASGASVSYWVAFRMIVDIVAKSAVVSYYGYSDMAHYDSGADHLVEESVSVDFSLIDPDGSLAQALLVLVQAAQQAKIDGGV